MGFVRVGRRWGFFWWALGGGVGWGGGKGGKVSGGQGCSGRLRRGVGRGRETVCLVVEGGEGVPEKGEGVGAVYAQEREGKSVVGARSGRGQQVCRVPIIRTAPCSSSLSEAAPEQSASVCSYCCCNKWSLCRFA